MADDELGDTMPASAAPAVTSADWLPRGTRVGRYEILGTLGAGGMGIVYAAHDPELDRRIALKLLRGRPTDDTGHARIRREAQALARANHPNIVTVYDVGDHGDGVFIAMEIVEGGTLRQWQATHGWRETLGAYLAAGRGLAAAHARGLVHRDFKPENVLVSAGDRVCVTDFGLARLADGAAIDPADAGHPRAAPASAIALTMEGAVMGTVGYMSPEQCDGSAVDARSDQFAWCVSLWEALYGARPFRGATLLEFVGAMAITTPAVPDVPAIPKAIGRALLRGLSAGPDARWPAMEPLLDACGPPRSRRGLAIAIAAGVVVVGTSIGLVVAGRGAPPAAAAASTCATGASRVAGIWDDGRRARLASHFATVARPDVQSALGLATRDFDTYAATWSTQWDAACTSADRTTDPLLYAQRVNCLERSLVDLQGVVQAYLEVEPGAFAASWAGNSFAPWATPLVDCERVASIRATAPAPTPARRREITNLIVDMHRARVEARVVLNYDDSQSGLDVPLARLDAIVGRLDALESPVAAEAAWWHAEYLSISTTRRSTLDRALSLARTYRDDRWLAFGYALEVSLALDRTRDLATVRAELAEMDQTYERSGGDPKHLDVHARVELASGHYAGALDAILASRTPGDALDHAGPDAESTDAIRLLVTMGRIADAVAEARHHLARAEAVWRGDDWIVADAHEVLAHTLLYAHDPAGALAELHASLEMHARIQSPPSRTYSARVLVLACTAILGRDAERDAMASTLVAAGTDPFTTAVDLAALWSPALLPWGLAHAKPSADLDGSASLSAYLVGDLATAERLARRTPVTAATIDEAGDRYLVLAMIEARTGRPVASRIATFERFCRSAKPVERDLATEFEALVEAARGDWPAVRALLEDATLPTFSVDSDHRARLDAMLGRALLETHEPARAVPVLERALFESVQVLYSYKNANYVIADTSLALARALWDSGGDHARARALATQAIAQYTTFQATQRRDAEAWLAAHR